MKEIVRKEAAQVGKDTYENVEYYIFECPTTKKEKSFKGKMEDLWDNITIPFYRLRNRIRDTYWEIRYGFQRMFKGYDAVDTFSTYSNFIDRYTKILTEFNKYQWGHPADMSMQEWKDIIDEMIYHLKYMDENNVIKELQKDVSEDWIPKYNIINEIMIKHKDEFFALFSKYFYNLWD